MNALPSDTRIAEEIRRFSGELLSGSPNTKSILVAGPMGGEGATTAATMLALALAARNGSSALLVDANLRAPRAHELLKLQAGPGLANWNGEGSPPYQYPQGDTNLAFLSAGAIAGDPGAPAGLDRLASLAALARRVREEFTYIVWDTSPALRYSDVITLAPLVDGVVVIVEVDRTRLDDLSYFRDQMQRVNANLLGAVMNRSGRYWPLRWNDRS